TSRGFRLGPSSHAIWSNERRGTRPSPMIRRAIVLLPAPALPRRISLITKNVHRETQLVIHNGFSQPVKASLPHLTEIDLRGAGRILCAVVDMPCLEK